MAILGSISSRADGVTNLNKVLADISNSYSKLSSGKRITGASDDAAALTMAAQLQSSISTLGQASRNVRDAGSALAIADGALSQIQEISVKLQELAVQSANGTYSDQQRSVMKMEYDALSEEVTRITATTQFNGVNLLEGSQIGVQIGTDASSSSQLALGSADLPSLIAQLGTQNIGSQSGAQSAMSALQQFSKNISNFNSTIIGTAQSRLDAVSQNITSKRIEETGVLSRIFDLDFAAEFAFKTNKEILAASSVAILAQSNKLNSSTLQKLIA